MRPMLFVVMVLFSTSLTAQQQIASGASREIVFEDVNVIPMDANTVLEHQTVVTKAGKITAVGAFKKVKYGKDALVINAKGKYLMPGLAEMHAHVPPIDDMEPMKDVLALF